MAPAPPGVRTAPLERHDAVPEPATTTTPAPDLAPGPAPSPRTAAPETPSLEGWSIVHVDDSVPWIPWGSDGKARARLTARADGYLMALVEAEPGYVTDPHTHAHTEFLYVIEGDCVNQGVPMTTGDVFAAAAGSRHSHFEALTPVRYLSVFKLPQDREDG
ncbi:cupin domain-containing protein [Streptomyces sp. SPB074]|uniref:cupin domain-containing protein n=1 Tax=Streptomyces sp. (strain SPB074) TaxID=465543 RepID=UPI00017F2618|nr:cupin domain-containing protein [Streptomyces sp. SPB074]